jgi:hypothetical protein
VHDADADVAADAFRVVCPLRSSSVNNVKLLCVECVLAGALIATAGSLQGDTASHSLLCCASSKR